MNKRWKIIWLSMIAFFGLLSIVPVIINNIDLNQFRSFVEVKVTEYTGRQFKIDGDIYFNLSLNPSFGIEKISFANPSWSAQPWMVVAEKIQLQIALLPLFEKLLVIDELVLKGAVLVVEKNSEGQASWLFGEVDAAEKNSDEGDDLDFLALPFFPIFKQVRFENVSVQYSDVDSKIETKVNIEALRLSNHALNEPFVFDVIGSVNGHPFDIIGETEYRGGASSSDDEPLLVKFDMNAIGIALSLNGEVKQPIIDGGLDVDVSLVVKDINNTFTAVTGQSLSLYSVNTKQSIPLQLSTKISNKKSSYDLSAIKLKLAGSDLKGSVSLINDSARQQVKVFLHSEALYLDQLLAKTSKRKSVADVPGETMPFAVPDIPLEFGWLKKIDGEFSYSAKQVQLDGLSVKDILFSAKLDDGRLQVGQLDFDVSDASVRGRFSIDGKRKVPLLNVAAVITKIDLSFLAKTAGFSQLQRGELNADINLEGKGDSVKSLLFSLGGQSKLHLSQLRMKQAMGDQLRDIYIDELTLNFTEMNGPMAFTMSGLFDKEEILVSGELEAVSSILNNRPTRLTTKTIMLGAELSVDAVSKQPMFLNSVQADIVVTIPEADKSFHRLSQIFPNINMDGDIPALPVSASAYLNIFSGTVNAKDINVVMGENDLHGNVVIDVGREKLFIKADVYSHLIDLDALPFLLKGKQVEQGDVSEREKLFSTAPLPSLNGLGYLNADIHYQLKRLTKNNQSIDNISLDLMLDEGELNLNPLKMNFFAGTIKTNLKLHEDNGLNFQTSIKITDLNYARLMALIGAKEYARGKFDANIHLQGAGNSMSELMAGLNGQVRLTSEGGSLNMDAMQLLSKDLVSLIPFTDSGDRQEIRCAVMQFNIDEGIARSHALVLDTGVVSALAAGEVDFAAESLSLYVSPRTKRTSVLKLALVPLNIRGSFLSPSITPDATGATVSTTNKAVHIGLAVATGGITLLAEDLTNKLWEQFIDNTDYCALALAGEKVVPTLVKLTTGGDELEQSEKDADYIEELDDDDGGM